MFRCTTGLLFILILNLISDVLCKIENRITIESLVFWPNATIPFYINPDHFDHEQSLAIMTALSVFSFKTCLKFSPTMSAPGESDHVLLFNNPDGKRRCEVKTEGHSVFEPHVLTLGYDCLKSPHIEMMVMKALGFPFEHNRPNRDLYIQVLMENVQPGSIELFTKSSFLPKPLRSLPYDHDSVMHFCARDYSKNGHKTIIFKDHKRIQNRVGLTDTDLRKIEIVYGPECLKRDRQAKIELCQSYPGVARRKRSILDQNLRINPQITPFPLNYNATKTTDAEKPAAQDVLQKTINELEIADEMDKVINDIETMIGLALVKAKVRYCNGTKTKPNKIDVTNNDLNNALGIITNLVIYNIEYSTNLTGFCSGTPLITRCGSGPNDRCRQTYRSTKSGNILHSTQHRPTYFISTNHYPLSRIKNLQRSGDDVIQNDPKKDRQRKKRDVAEKEVKEDNKAKEAGDNKGNEPVAAEKVENVPASEVKNETSRRTFEARRYRVKDHNSKKSKTEWDVSNVSSEKNTKVVKAKKTEVKMDEKSHKRPNKKRTRQRKLKRAASNVPKTVKMTKLNKEFYEDRKWPAGVVRYIIEDKGKYDISDVRQRLNEVNKVLKRRTCVRLQELSEDEVGKYQDYLVIDESPDYVTGRVGGRQNFGSIELLRGGQHRQHAAMMVMAMLGFYFEVARHDRDNYIRVHARHVRPDKLHHFEKIRSEATLPLPFDYSSATLPAWQFWRHIGRTGISTIATYKDQDPDGSVMRSLGQNEDLLSKNDIIKINTVYGVKCFRKVRKGLKNRSVK